MTSLGAAGIDMVTSIPATHRNGAMFAWRKSADEDVDQPSAAYRAEVQSQ